ncbi:uncharacterized protein LOC122945997 isoform X7 [Bufo gargarizans]|uniref:uncharacterized protein LOC122945997 isoform X7 n=1 Tax=Bufo gargarizans TaxID=30331 RepID=UPI001CF470E9|nr:uncharacterized protein LOC122945997 isoform X7 [Bufo gargarizans]
MMEHCHSFKSLDCTMVKPGVMVKIEEEELYDPHYDGRSETSTGYPLMNPETMIKEERNEEDSFIRNEEMYEEEESPESSIGEPLCRTSFDISHYVKNVVVKRKKDDGAHGIVDQQFEERISSPEPSPDYILVKIKEEEAGEPYGMNYQRRPIGKGTHRRISMGREKDGRVHRISSKMVIDIDRLIQMVHDRPELYDPKVPSYADRYKKKKAWDEICSVVVPGWDRCSEKEKNLKVKAIKTRWNSCRDQFRRELTVKGKSTEGRLSKRPYIFTNQLMFLRDILHLRQARDSQEDLPEEESEHSNETQLDVAEVDTPSVSSACSPQPNPEEPSFLGMSAAPLSVPDPVPRSSGTRKREQDTTVASPAPNTQAQIDSRVLDYLKRSSAEGPEDIFLRSLAPHLKQVAPERQLRCQSALMGVIEVFASASDPRELYQAVEYYRAQADGPSTSGPYSPGPPAPRPSQFRPHESSQSFYSRDRPGYHKPNYYAPPAP